MWQTLRGLQGPGSAGDMHSQKGHHYRDMQTFDLSSVSVCVRHLSSVAPQQVTTSLSQLG